MSSDNITKQPNDELVSEPKQVTCCEVGCWKKIMPVSGINCSYCARPMCSLHYNEANMIQHYKEAQWKGMCNICIWNSFT